MQEFDAKAQELGTVGAAARWASENGYELPPAEDSAQGGLNMAASQEIAMPEDDDPDVEAQDEELGGLGGLGNLDYSTIRSDPNFFNNLSRAYEQADQRAAQSAQQLYEQGRQRILEKYAGPSEAQRLYALSAALLRPTKVRGFKGMLGNIMGNLEQDSTARRQAEMSREEKLFALQQQYLQGETSREAARPKTALDLAKAAALASKPEKRRTGFDPVKDMDTGELIGEGGELPVLSPEKVAILSRDPRNRGMKFRTDDGRVMEIK